MAMISVIMPVFNAELYLKAAIESILNQTYNNFELIILNDCSTDNSKVIIEEFAEKDDRILFINKKHNVGPAKLRNEGIEIATGEFIALMDADDIAIETRFEKQLEIFKLNSEIGVCGSWFTNFGDNIKKKVIKHAEHHNEIKARFLIDCTIGNSTAMIRKNVIQSVRHNENLKIAIDYEFWSHLIQQANFYNIQESLLFYRIHKNNISTTRFEKLYETKIIIKNNFLNKLKINANEFELISFTNLLECKKNLDNHEIKQIISSGLKIMKKNQKYKVFDNYYLQKTIHYLTLRSIKKTNKICFKTIQYIKQNNLDFYKSISLKNKLKLFCKAFLNIF